VQKGRMDMISEDTTLEDFQEQFDTEEACIAYFFQAKWPNGFSCSRCGHNHAYTINTRRLSLYECRQCHYQSSIISGTILEGSRTDLRKWLLSIFLISRADQGINAVKLSSIIQVTYKTAWLMLRKIRHAISTTDGQMLLSGIVRVNAATYGKPYNSSFCNHPQEHPVLIGSSMNQYNEPTYIKIKLVSESNWHKRQISPSGTAAFTHRHVEPHMKDIEYVTGRFNPKRFRQLLSLVDQASKWIHTTFHGLGSKHLQAYMDEFTYRVNLNLQKKPIFPNLTQLCVSIPAVTYLFLTRIA
jgi:transposase-like protein